jgi:hypothetical protein
VKGDNNDERLAKSALRRDVPDVAGMRRTATRLCSVGTIITEQFNSAAPAEARTHWRSLICSLDGDLTGDNRLHPAAKVSRKEMQGGHGTGQVSRRDR